MCGNWRREFRNKEVSEALYTERRVYLLVDVDLEEEDQEGDDNEPDDRNEDPPDDFIPKLILDLLPSLILLSEKHVECFDFDDSIDVATWGRTRRFILLLNSTIVILLDLMSLNPSLSLNLR
jgi:hypothetical protein